MMIDRKAFFDGARPLFGSLNASQVAGMESILAEWEKRKLTDDRWLAYMLGTAKIETNHTMQPVHEFGGPAYFTKLYDVAGRNPDRARKMGNTKPGDGIKYCGRGYVQLTWFVNYLRMTKALKAADIDVDLVANPDLAMRDDIAAFVMFEGMIQGIFTSQKLDQYFNAKKTDYQGARAIINGRDRAAEIAFISKKFCAAIQDAS